MPRINYQNKKTKKRVNVDNNKENIYEKIILQDVEHIDVIFFLEQTFRWS